MLGVFGIDSYDDYQGAYQFDRDYGIFRYGDRRVVQGMKLWTFGYGDSGKRSVNTYTDNAGPYVELQSGRYVWDGHYEWVHPHKTESWSEWWVPVAGTGGLTTLSRDVALRLDIGATGTLALAATRVFKGAMVRVRARSGEALNVRADLDPAKPFLANFALKGEAAEVVVEVRSADGRELLHYERPDSPPGRKDYTPFTRPLERLHQAAAERTVEELVLAGEFRLKELDDAGATALFEQALAKDPGYSRAHLQLGIQHYLHANYEQAVKHLDRAIERDPYSAESYYHLALSLLALGRDKEAERNLYYIWTDSGFYGSREYQLGRLALIRGELDSAIRHFEGALDANSGDLNARVALALALDDKGNRDAALQQLTAAAQLQPSSRLALAARYAISGEAATELRRMLGGQTREAMTVALLFEDLRRWKDAVRLLKSVESDSRDPYGVPPEFYYTLAYCQRRAGDAVAADAALKQARAANGHIDRFPSRQESVAPLEEAAKLDPSDSQAHFLLACLLYHLDRPADAIVHWEAAIAANPRDFSSRRALGLALAERGETDQAAGQLQKAIELNPSHVRTLNDLSNLYARAGRFDAQLDLLKHALAKSPKDDDLAEGLLTAYLLKGEYAGAERLISEHVFSPRHRSYGLRDKYRIMRFAQGSIALNRGDAAAALACYEETSRPPASLGMDDFAAQSTPRQQYYLGRAYEALGRKQDAQAAYARAVQGVEQLSGDRDSWSGENYFMVLALERLGRAEEAARLKKSFANFGQSETDDRSSHRRAAARYLLGLMARYEGRSGDANRLLRGAIEASPDLLAAQIELRGETPAPAGKDAPRDQTRAFWPLWRGSRRRNRISTALTTPRSLQSRGTTAFSCLRPTRHPARRYPVIYYFHGHSDRYTLEKYDNGQDTVPKIAAFVAAHDCIVVAADGYVARDYTGFYGGAPYDVMRGGGEFDYGEYFLELTRHIDATYRTLTGRRYRATSGLSMGGYMSLYLSARYPDLIGSASAFNPGPEFYSGEPGRRSLWRPKDHVMSHQHTMIRLIRASGDYISQYHEETRAAYAATPEVDFEFRQDEYHRHWATSIGETFEFHMRAFANPLLDVTPQQWSYTSAFRSFEVRGYRVSAPVEGPALTLLEHVTTGGFRVRTRRWAPDGPPASCEQLTAVTAPLYRPGAVYKVLDYSFARRSATDPRSCRGQGRPAHRAGRLQRPRDQLHRARSRCAGGGHDAARGRWTPPSRAGHSGPPAATRFESAHGSHRESACRGHLRISDCRDCSRHGRT